MEDPRQPITEVLLAARAGDADAAERLWRLVYQELRRIAHRELRGERADHTLSTTDLVGEAYLRLIDQTQAAWRDRRHFYALACRAMRRILVDYARQHNAQKRRARHHQVTLDEALVMADVRSEDLLALDEALEHLGAMDERLVRVVECRFFVGLSVKETAEVLEVGRRTIVRDWQRAKAHLYLALRAEPS